MLNKPFFSVLAILIALSGCGQTSLVSRNAHDLSFVSEIDSDGDAQMIEQAQALDQMTRELVRSTTGKGAAVGAATGCSFALFSGSNSARCLTGALFGGAAGAAIGHDIGKKQVADRIEIVSLNRVVPAIVGAQKQMAHLTDTMPSLIAEQDAEMAMLKSQMDSGAITPSEYDLRIGEIRDTRAQVTTALTLSAEQARAAKTALKEAGDKGQQGLEWHILQVDTLEDEAISARSRITLL